MVSIRVSNNGNNVVSMDAVERFTRKLAHDWRNTLNCVDLHLSAVSQSDNPAEMAQEIQSAHELVKRTARQLSHITRRIAECSPNLIQYPLSYFMEDFQSRMQTRLGEAGARQFAWQVEVGNQQMELDFEVLSNGLGEIFTNALQFNPPETAFTVKVTVDSDGCRLILSEPKDQQVQPEKWSGDPLFSQQHGHYGLGLYHLRKVLAKHGGTVRFSYDSDAKVLHTEVRLPLLEV